MHSFGILLHHIGRHTGHLERYHTLSYQGISGNEKADDPAEAGRMKNPLNFEQPFQIPPHQRASNRQGRECNSTLSDPAKQLDFSDMSLDTTHTLDPPPHTQHTIL